MARWFGVGVEVVELGGSWGSRIERSIGEGRVSVYDRVGWVFDVVVV
jgi:hypothetical protein